MSATSELEKIKLRMDLNGNDYHDDKLKELIEDVKFDLLSLGVSQTKIESPKALSVIAQGVKDLWNNVSGATKYSSYFYDRVDRLRREKESEQDVFTK